MEIINHEENYQEKALLPDNLNSQDSVLDLGL